MGRRIELSEREVLALRAAMALYTATFGDDPDASTVDTRQDIAALVRVNTKMAAAQDKPHREEDHEHVRTVYPVEMAGLRTWLEKPNGSFNTREVTLEAVQHGGIWVRTPPEHWRKS